MNKTLLIIQREYLSRVKKKAFLIMTFLVPLLIIAMYALIFFLSMRGGDNIPTVEVIDESGIFNKSFENKRSVNFISSKLSLAEAKKKVIDQEDTFILFIPKGIKNGESIELFAQKNVGLSVITSI